MAKTLKKYEFLGDFIAGRFQVPTDPTGGFTHRSPADLSDELAEVKHSYASVETAVGSARQAFAKWKAVPTGERAGYLKKYQAALKAKGELISECIARETGKPLWEAKTELTAMLNKVDITINESLRFAPEFEIKDIMDNTHGRCRARPHGVMAVIGPFNFPGHLPNGHLVPALLTGNTVVFKPSEKTPMIAQIMAECFQEAGFPSGVFNLLQGEKEVGRRLCVHEDVDGILFTGSYEVGTRIKQDTLTQHWKILALEMGGKNPVIVWKDADLEVAISETLQGAFLTAGQRCSATSRVLVHESLHDAFVSKFHEMAKSFKIGHPFEDPFMGPLIESGAVDRYMKFLGIASREGCEIVMRGKALELAKKGYYVAPSICLTKDSALETARKSVYQQTELFAPNVAITKINDLDQAVALANVTQYGLVASVFSKDRATYAHAAEELEFGLINWNKSTVGASSRLPFGGLKKSGNHFPTALMATAYCASPVASLEVENPKVAKPLPGMGA